MASATGPGVSRLADYAAGSTRVVVNVAVLTEGWDHPPTSCVVLLRPSSYKSTMIQMVGRGLRTVDPEEHPGVVKTDCIVLDFGTSSLIHGTLEQDVDLDGKTETGEAPTKTCPACEAEIPLAATECPLCGEAFPREDLDAGESGGAAPLSGFMMTEIDLLKRSSFAWVDLYGTDDALMATGFAAWGGIFWLDGVWYAIGGAKGERPHLLGVGERTRRADAISDFGDARLWSEATRIDLRVAEVPAPRPGDRIEIEGDAFLIQGEPVRDRERLVWTVDLRPT